MNTFKIDIIPAMNGCFTVYITDGAKTREFCGTMPEVGEFVKIVVTQPVA
jgi:hypothetical protein